MGILTFSDHFVKLLKRLPETDAELGDCLSVLGSFAPTFRMLPEDEIDRTGIREIRELNDFLTTDKSSAMYFHALPGSGKGLFGSVLFRECQVLDQVITTYYSFSTRDMRRVSNMSLLASTIFQILVSDCSKFEKVRGIYATIRARSLWTDMALWTLFKSLLAVQNSSSFIFIINGVHYWDSSSEQFLSLLVEYLLSTPQPKTTRFLFIGSRRNELENALRPFATFPLDDREFFRNLSRNSTESMLAKLIDEKPYLADFRGKLEEKLNGCANGLLLALTAEVLRQGFFKVTEIAAAEPKAESLMVLRRGEWLYTSGLLRAGLELIPSNLAALVTTAFESLPVWAHTALGWMLFSRRPLEIKELRVALALRKYGSTVEVDHDALAVDLAEDLKSAFGPFIEFSGYRVALRHEEVKNAFLEAHSCLAERDSQLINHWSITQLLLKYLVSEEVLKIAKFNLAQERSPLSQESTFQLAEYAALYWPAHYREAKRISRQPEELLKLLPAGTDIDVWHQIHWQLGGKALRQDKFTWDPFFLAAQLGREDIVDFYLGSRSFEDRATAACWASWAGNFEILESLLQYEMPNTPIAVLPVLLDAVAEAASRGHERIVHALLGHFKERSFPYDWNPIWLCQAAEMGFISLVKLFIEKGAPVEGTHHGTTPLQLATRNGHYSVVKYLLMDGHADPDSRKADDACKPILLAALHGFAPVATLLLDHADLKLHDGKGRTALHLAILHCNQEVIELLMNNALERFDLTLRDDKGRTVLHWASERGYHNIAQSLADAWTEGVNVKDEAGDTPLILSAQGGHTLVAKMLINRAAEVDFIGANGHTALYIAVNGGHEELAGTLITKMDSSSHFPDIGPVLREAAKRGFLEICKFCIPLLHETDIQGENSRGQTALQLAVSGGFDEIVSLLLDCGATVDEDDKSKDNPVSIAAYANRWHIVEILLQFCHQKDIPRNSKKNQQLLRLLAGLPKDVIPVDKMDDHVHTIKVLLEAGVDPNIVDTEDSFQRQTALHSASAVGKVEVMQVLLDHDANPLAKSQFEWIPLFSAAISDVKEAIELLLPLSGDTIALDDDGWTPLHVAALNGKLKAMEVLLNHDGEMLDYRSYNGSTPLHVIHNASAAARWLLDQGANVNACTEKGATPLIIAVKKECEDVVEVLISRRADIRIFDDSNKTALHHVFEVVWRLNDSILSCLLNQDPAAANDKNHDGDTVLHLAVKSSFKVVDMVLNKSPSEKRSEIDANIKNNSGDTPLLLAVKKHSQDSSMLPTIQALLKFGVNTELSDSTGDTALLIATNHKHEDAMEELLKKAAVDVPDKEGNTPLLLAVRSDQENIVKLLLRHKASPQIRNKNNETALSISVKGKNKDILKLLSDREHHSSTKNQLPTPLHIYAVDGDLESLQELVEKENPDVNAIGGAFHTALQAAAACGFEEIVNFLLRNGADPAIEGGIFGHALSAAASSGLFEYVDRFLAPKYNVNVNFQDEQGRTAMHMAAWRGDLHIFQTLKGHRGSTTIKDFQGRTILHHAVMGESGDIFREIIESEEFSALDVADADDWLPLHWACKEGTNLEFLKTLTKNREYWLNIPAHLGCTPENIAIFHEAGSLIPVGPTKWNVGSCYWSYSCDGCQFGPIYGIRWRCTDCEDFDFCFKCAWSRERTHDPTHRFKSFGQGIPGSPEHLGENLIKESTLMKQGIVAEECVVTDDGTTADDITANEESIVRKEDTMADENGEHDLAHDALR